MFIITWINQERKGAKKQVHTRGRERKLLKRNMEMELKTPQIIKEMKKTLQQN